MASMQWPRVTLWELSAKDHPRIRPFIWVLTTAVISPRALHLLSALPLSEMNSLRPPCPTCPQNKLHVYTAQVYIHCSDPS